MDLSEVIINRLKEANVNFKANDNISEYISPEEKKQLLAEVETKLEAVLRSLVIDIDNCHNTKETAKRVAKMYLNEIYSGRYDPLPKVTSFPNMGYKSLYTAGPISVRSNCAHHMMPIVGNCWVGVVPENDVIGLSKFNRIIHHICERPQIQEELTSQIADALTKYAKTENIAVVVKAEHFCLTHRGVKEHESDMATAIMRGAFERDAALKKEFYDIMLSQKGH